MTTDQYENTTTTAPITTSYHGWYSIEQFVQDCAKYFKYVPSGTNHWSLDEDAGLSEDGSNPGYCAELGDVQLELTHARSKEGVFVWYVAMINKGCEVLGTSTGASAKEALESMAKTWYAANQHENTTPTTPITTLNPRTLALFEAACKKHFPTATGHREIQFSGTDDLVSACYVADLGGDLVTLLAYDHNPLLWDAFLDQGYFRWHPHVAAVTDPDVGLRELAEKIEKEKAKAAK